MKIIGHRGAREYAPENTLASFKKALQLGVDMLEFDVHVLPSGEVVLMHDLLVDRTTNGQGYITETSFEALRLLDAGEGEQLPTLQEVLDLVNRRVPVDIELKGPGTAKAVADIIKIYLGRGWQVHDFFVSSFNHPELQKFKQLLPQVDVGALMSGMPLDYAAFAEQLHAAAVCPGHEFIDKAYVEDAHARGLKVYVHTINLPVEVRRMFRLGVDGIFTDVPDIARHAMNELETYGDLIQHASKITQQSSLLGKQPRTPTNTQGKTNAVN